MTKKFPKKVLFSEFLILITCFLKIRFCEGVRNQHCKQIIEISKNGSTFLINFVIKTPFNKKERKNYSH